MYCGECGAKNKEGALFCEECGKPLEGAKAKGKSVKKEKPVASAPKERKPMTKQTKLGLTIGGIVIAVLVIGFMVGNNLTDPKKVATKYFEAMTSYDADKIYPYLDTKESEFANKKIFKKVLEKSLDGKKVPKVENYKVTETKKNDSGLVMTVKINYTMEGSSSDQTETIELTKSKNKKFLFFDQWNVATKGLNSVNNFKLTVLKDSNVTLEGIKVDKKYLDKKASTSSKDVYKLPALFPMTYEMKVELPLGFTLEDELNASNYSGSKDVQLDKDNIPSAEQKKIADKVKSDLSVLYNGSIEGKSFDDIKSNFEYTDGNLSDLQEEYDSLKSNLTSSSTKLTKIEYKDAELRTVKLDDNGHLDMYIYLKYDYTVQYQSGSETKTKTKSTSDGVYVTYDYKNKEYRLVDVSSLQTYFSRY